MNKLRKKTLKQYISIKKHEGAKRWAASPRQTAIWSESQSLSLLVQFTESVIWFLLANSINLHDNVTQDRD